MKYRNKPKVIEAVLWDGEKVSEVPAWILDALNADPGLPGHHLIRLLW